MTVLLHPVCATAPRDMAEIERETDRLAVHRNGRAELVEVPDSAPPRVSFCRADPDTAGDTVRALVDLALAIAGERT